MPPENQLVTVYRGTSRTAEIMINEDTGYLMSDSMMNSYMENGGNIGEAYKQAAAAHENWVKLWGNEETYVQAHGEFGIEMPKAFRMDRTMMSVTTDKETAIKFAGENGVVYKAEVPKSELIPQTIEDSGENEYLIKCGREGFKPDEN